MDWVCTACGTKLRGATVTDGRMSGRQVMTREGAPTSCSNPACVHYGRPQQAGWYRRAED
jgi:hypothetical protein